MLKNFSRIISDFNFSLFSTLLISNAKLLSQHTGISIKFFSNLNQDDLRKIYCESEIAVVPSLYEGFGFAAIEAMACGIPLVSSSGGALPEVIKDAGIIIPPKDSEEIFNSIKLLLSSPDISDNLIAKALKRVNSKFSWKVIAEKLEKIYQKEIENFKYANN